MASAVLLVSKNHLTIFDDHEILKLNFITELLESAFITQDSTVHHVIRIAAPFPFHSSCSQLSMVCTPSAYNAVVGGHFFADTLLCEAREFSGQIISRLGSSFSTAAFVIIVVS